MRVNSLWGVQSAAMGSQVQTRRVQARPIRSGIRWRAKGRVQGESGTHRERSSASAFRADPFRNLVRNLDGHPSLPLRAARGNRSRSAGAGERGLLPTAFAPEADRCWNLPGNKSTGARCVQRQGRFLLFWVNGALNRRPEECQIIPRLGTGVFAFEQTGRTQPGTSRTDWGFSIG